MGEHSKIQWTDSTWNPVTGCTRVSEGCRNCYMARTVPRQGQDPWTVVLHPERIYQPSEWVKPRRIFVNSLSDLFHEDIPDAFIDQVMRVMANTKRHTYQILTKRPERMKAYLSGWWNRCYQSFETEEYIPVQPLHNIWFGVSIENQATADERIPLLLQTPAAVRFVSAEPLLGPVDFQQVNNSVCLAEGQDFIDALRGFAWTCSGPDYVDTCGVGAGIDWVIVGGESGPGARPCDVAWIRSIKEQCKAAGVPVFIKQIGKYHYCVCPQCGRSCGNVLGGFVDECGPAHVELIEGMKKVRDGKGGDWNEWQDHFDFFGGGVACCARVATCARRND